MKCNSFLLTLVNLLILAQLNGQIYLISNIGLSAEKYYPLKEYKERLDHLERPFSTWFFIPSIGINYKYHNIFVSNSISFSKRKFDFLAIPSNGFPPVDVYWYNSFDYEIKFGSELFNYINDGIIIQFSKLNQIKFSYLNGHQFIGRTQDVKNMFISYFLGYQYDNFNAYIKYLPHSFISPKNTHTGYEYYPIEKSNRLEFIIQYALKLFNIKYTTKSKINCPTI